MRQKIITSLLWSCIVSIFCGVFAFVYEVFFGFPAYLDGLENQNGQGFGIVGIILIGFIAGAVLLLFGILCLIATAGLKKCEMESLKGWTIFGIIAQFLLTVAIIAYAVLMMLIYPGGYVGKIVYFCFAVIPLLLGIINCVRCGKMNSD